MKFRRLNLQIVAVLQLPLLSWLEKQRRQETATCGEVEDEPLDKPSTTRAI